MQHSLATSDAAAPPAGARHLVILCALLSAAARFIPVPLLDDLVRERVHQVLLSRLLKAYGRSYSSSVLRPLWIDPDGCSAGCMSLLWRVPLKLLLFPIRKLLSIITALTGFSKDVTQTVLFGRSVERALSRGRLPEGSPAPALEAEGRRVRNAFEFALAQTDTSVVVATLSDVLRDVRGLSRAALRSARALLRTKSERPEAAGSDSDQSVVDRGAQQVERALDQREIQVLLAGFDQRFDQALDGPPAQG